MNVSWRRRPAGFASYWSLGTAAHRGRIVPRAGVLAVWLAAISLASAAPATMSAGVPSIAAIAPTEGAAGTTITITGSGLDSATAVTFNEVAASFAVVSDSELTATVPVGAGDGPVHVVTGSGATDSPSAFLYIPVQHIVIVVEENHSFDDLLGKFCVDQHLGLITRSGVNDSCDGADVGELHDGTTLPLSDEPDGGLVIDHSVADQQAAIDNGQMNGFESIKGCGQSASPPYACFTQYDPLGGPCGANGTSTCIPNVITWATQFAISDRTFEFRDTPSWAGHMVLGDATIQRFLGDIPAKKAFSLPTYPGWGCDSGLLTQWINPNGTESLVPPCVPDSTGSMGPLWDGTQYAAGPHAQYAPTIFQTLTAAGRSWRIYGGGGPLRNGKVHGGYGWSICPTFWSCIGSAEASNFVPNARFAKDAAVGKLPAVSFVTPGGGVSMHQPSAASVGDNWLAASVIEPLMHSPDWGSSAVFLTWDDCGCFYDHVPPPYPGWGVRLPMIIISPFARAGYTDSQPASVVSMLTFIEHVYGIPPLHPCATVDSWNASCSDDFAEPGGVPTYDYMNAFNWTQTPLAPTRGIYTPLSKTDRRRQPTWARMAGDQGT